MSEEVFTDEDGSLVKTVPTPKLSSIDKLYVRAYLSTLCHIKAHKVVAPTLKSHHSDNTFSRKEAIQFAISLGLQESMEAFSLSPEAIVAKLYKEATREGGGSNHAARVSALTILGKQFGMFQDKKEAIVPTINIINYASLPIASDTTKALAKEVTSLEESVELPTYSLSTSPIEYEIKYL